MISAAEALCLPRARLSPSDAEAVAAYLGEVEAYVREHMLRVGCIVPVNPNRMNPTIAAEVEHRLRLQGWKAEFQRVAVQSTLAPGNKIANYQLALAPTDAAYEEADRTIAASGN